jgi:hypothetical protein
MTREWLNYRTGPDGIDFLEAAFDRHVYDRHIHETYAIGVTLRGVQRFRCACSGGGDDSDELPRAPLT